MLLPNAILKLTLTFVFWCLSLFLEVSGFSLALQTNSGHTRRKHRCDCGAGTPAGRSTTAALQGRWVKQIWTFVIAIKETKTLNGFGIWNQKPDLNVSTGPSLQIKLNWMFRSQLWQRNQSYKSKSAFCISDPLVMLIILCPFTVSNSLETLKWFIKWIILPKQTPVNKLAGNAIQKQG